MELREAIRTNGTVRDFTDEPVDDATITSILDDARFAPSGGNRQPWRVAVVKDRMLRRELATLMQPVWDEYLETAMVGGTPFNAVDYVKPDLIGPNKPNALLDDIEAVPVVLAVAVDLSARGDDGRPTGPPARHRWRIDLSVLLEPDALCSRARAGWRDDDVPQPGGTRRRTRPRAS